MEIYVLRIASRGEFSVINLLFGIVLLIIREPLFGMLAAATHRPLLDGGRGANKFHHMRIQNNIFVGRWTRHKVDGSFASLYKRSLVVERYYRK